MRRLLVAILVTLPAMAAAQQAGWGNLGKKQAEVFTWSKWWTEPLFGGFWMAWTRATLAFFLFVFAAIALLAVLEWRWPGGKTKWPSSKARNACNWRSMRVRLACSNGARRRIG